MIRQINKMVSLLEETNKILREVEAHLYTLTKAPDMIAMAKDKKQAVVGSLPDNIIS